MSTVLNKKMGAYFATMFEDVRHERSLLLLVYYIIIIKKPVFEKGNANWISELPSVIKQYSNTIHSSTEVIPIQGS